jgi:hypothetical protein
MSLRYHIGVPLTPCPKCKIFPFHSSVYQREAISPRATKNAAPPTALCDAALAAIGRLALVEALNPDCVLVLAPVDVREKFPDLVAVRNVDASTPAGIVAFGGMPVMTPLASVIVVYDVKPFSYANVVPVPVGLSVAE